MKGTHTKMLYIGKLLLNIRYGRWRPPELILIKFFTRPPKLLPAFIKSLVKISYQVIRVFEAYIKTDHFMLPVAGIEIIR